MQAVGPTRTPASPPAETETPVRFVSVARHTAASKVSQVLSPNAHRWDVHHGAQFQPSAYCWHVHHGAKFTQRRAQPVTCSVQPSSVTKRSLKINDVDGYVFFQQVAIEFGRAFHFKVPREPRLK
jgi:hypothetical protein